jgi:thioredoxin 1
LSELLTLDMLNDIRGLIEHNPKVLIEFGAVWCGPCRQFLPHFKRFAAKHEDFICVKVDVDVDPAVVSEYGIQTVPQVMLFENGRYVRTLPNDVRTIPKLEQNLY